MAVTKYNIRRLKRLLAMLKENRYPNYPRFLAEMKRQDLAGAYELSARTLQRDIACLKSEYGAPIAYDRVLATEFGVRAVELIKEEKYGNMVVYNHPKISYVSLEKALEEPNFVKPATSDLVRTARGVGISFGDKPAV